MRYAVISDEPYRVNETAVEELEKRGHTVIRFGSLKTGRPCPWVTVAREAAEAIRRGECDEGVFFCWTGTGVCIAANKVPGIRAALCIDAQSARGARIWNHANVLALSNRLTTDDLAREILTAWLDAPADHPLGADAVKELANIETSYRDFATR